MKKIRKFIYDALEIALILQFIVVPCAMIFWADKYLNVCGGPNATGDCEMTYIPMLGVAFLIYSPIGWFIGRGIFWIQEKIET